MTFVLRWILNYFWMEGVSFYKKLCLKIWIWRCNIGLNFSFKKKTWHWIWRCEVTVKLEDAMLLWNSADLIYPVRLNQSRNFENLCLCCWCLAAGNWVKCKRRRWGCELWLAWKLNYRLPRIRTSCCFVWAGPFSALNLAQMLIWGPIRSPCFLKNKNPVAPSFHLSPSSRWQAGLRHGVVEFGPLC